MEWFAVAGIAILIAVVTAICAAFALARHRLQRAHRVDPKVPSPAPASWLADPRTPARLHRRLTKVGRAAGAVADDHRVAAKRWRTVEQPPIVELALRLRAQAVGADHELARVALLPAGVRRPAMGELQHTVMDLEHAAARLVALSAEVRTPPRLAIEDAALFDVAAQIERLEQAHRELLEVDAANGLVPPPRAATPPTSAPGATSTSTPSPRF